MLPRPAMHPCPAPPPRPRPGLSPLTSGSPRGMSDCPFRPDSRRPGSGTPLVVNDAHSWLLALTCLYLISEKSLQTHEEIHQKEGGTAENRSWCPCEANLCGEIKGIRQRNSKRMCSARRLPAKPEASLEIQNMIEKILDLIVR